MRDAGVYAGHLLRKGPLLGFVGVPRAFETLLRLGQLLARLFPQRDLLARRFVLPLQRLSLVGELLALLAPVSIPFTLLRLDAVAGAFFREFRLAAPGIHVTLQVLADLGHTLLDLGADLRLGGGIQSPLGGLVPVWHPRRVTGPVLFNAAGPLMCCFSPGTRGSLDQPKSLSTWALGCPSTPMIVDAAALLIGLREGLEALLIIGILLGMLKRFGHADKARYVWIGAGLGLVASVALGLIIQALFAAFFEEGPGAAWFEIIVALVAVAILTYMVIWMEKHTRTLVDTVKRQTEKAANDGRWVLIGSLAFFTVVREGVEVVLFFAARLQDLGWDSLIVSGAIGIAISAALTYAFFRLSVKVSLRAFFGITGIMLVVIAAGLLVHVVMAATDAGIIPTSSALWDMSGTLPDHEHWLGGPLHAFVGYTAAPTALQLLLYLGYIVGVGGWYMSRLVAPASKRKASIVAAALMLILVSSFAVSGAYPDGMGTAGHTHGSEDRSATEAGHSELITAAAAAIATYDGKVGVLIRHHGEPVHYNATTYESFKQFIDGIWPYTGFPPEMLQVDQGTILVDNAHLYDDQPHMTDARFVDAWLAPNPGPAIPVTWPLPFSDPAGASSLPHDLAGGQFYITPGTGPGLGEGDVYEMLGLGTYRDWMKMENSSPMHASVQDAWSILGKRIETEFDGKVIVAFTSHVDPKVNPEEASAAAAQKLVDGGATIIIDTYMSSVFSDAMNTCMMAPHVEHDLRTAGFKGKIVASTMAGTNPHWAAAAADEVQRLLEEYPEGEEVAVYLTQHGGKPNGPNPCGPEGSKDQYTANVQAEYALAEAAVKARDLGRNVTVRNVYGQRADAAEDGVLSPMEAIALDREAGVRHVVFLPYEFWGNALDNLVYLRESLNFTAEMAPYYGPGYTTRLTVDGVDVFVASARYGTDLKAHALLERISEAILKGLDAETPTGDHHAHPAPVGLPRATVPAKKPHWVAAPMPRIISSVGRAA